MAKAVALKKSSSNILTIEAFTEKRRPETSQPKFKKLKEEDALLNSKLKEKFDLISEIHDKIEFRKYPGGSDI